MAPSKGNGIADICVAHPLALNGKQFACRLDVRSCLLETVTPPGSDRLPLICGLRSVVPARRLPVLRLGNFFQSD